MSHFKYLKLLTYLFILIFMTACSPKTYSFEIDAPPKYREIFKTMQIVEFQSNRPEYQQILTRMVETSIAREGYLRILQNAAESTLKGTIKIHPMQIDNDTSSYECKKKVNGEKVKTTCYSYTYKKENEITVTYSLVNNKNNAVIFGESLTESFSDSWYSSESRANAQAKAKSDGRIINELLKKLSKKITNAVSPHKETISLELQDGDGDENIKLGITYVENGRVEQALSIWGQAIHQAKNQEVMTAAYYNIGVIKESQGFYQDAFELYSKANNILPQEVIYIKAMTRTEKLNKKSRKVREWQ